MPFWLEQKNDACEWIVGYGLILNHRVARQGKNPIVTGIAGAIGLGSGKVAGPITGMKIGVTVGSIGGPVGTFCGAIGGGIIGMVIGIQSGMALATAVANPIRTFKVLAGSSVEQQPVATA